MKKSYYIGMVAILFGMTTGCTSTVTLGPKANDTAVLGAKAGTDGASVTLPFIKGEVGPAEKKK